MLPTSLTPPPLSRRLSRSPEAPPAASSNPPAMPHSSSATASAPVTNAPVVSAPPSNASVAGAPVGSATVASAPAAGAAVAEQYRALLEKACAKFARLRELPLYGRQRWEARFHKAFSVYSRLWRFQQEHRARLVDHGLKRWEIGEIASRIGQLYYNYYLRTGDASYLLEAFIFYDAIHRREYFREAARGDAAVAHKQLRWLARFTVVCVLLGGGRCCASCCGSLGCSSTTMRAPSRRRTRRSGRAWCTRRCASCAPTGPPTARARCATPCCSTHRRRAAPRRDAHGARRPARAGPAGSRHHVLLPARGEAERAHAGRLPRAAGRGVAAQWLLRQDGTGGGRHAGLQRCRGRGGRWCGW
ncbi:hypothetical protein CLOP_g12627 [Closterium sp. NIES-67]|nr:hypothetical protein CLOP_g12627 [Closterium sp. NIES-67]